MPGRKSLRAKQLELARDIHHAADRLAVESAPDRATASIEMINRATGELVGIIKTLATVGA